MEHVRCNVCGMQAVEGQVFAWDGITSGKLKRYCPNCHQRFQEKTQRISNTICFSLLILGCLFLLSERTANMGRVCVNFLSFYFFSMVGVCVHELAHAFTGRALGLNIQKVELGMGRLLFHLQLFGFDFELRGIPLAGLVRLPPGGAGSLKQHALLYAAGPVSNLVLACISYPFASHLWPFSLSEHWLLVESFFIANALLLLNSLNPVVSTIRGQYPSDGLALYQILFLRRVPFVPQSVEQNKKKTGFNPLNFVVRWIVLAFIFCFFLLISVVFFFSLQKLSTESHPMDFLPAGVLGGVAVALFVCMFLIYRNKFDAPQQSKGLSAHERVLAEYTAEVRAKSQYAKNGLLEPEFQKALKARDEAKVFNLLSDSKEDSAENLIVQLWKLDAFLAFHRYPEAKEHIESLLKKPLGDSSKSVLLSFYARCLIEMNQFTQLRSRVEEVIPSLPTYAKIYLLDVLTCAPFMNDQPQYLNEAFHWSELALQLQPESLTLKGSKAALLVEVGKFDEAEPLLKEVLEKSVSDTDDGISSFYLGLIAKHQGEKEKHAKLMKRAKSLHREPWLVKRVEKELTEI
jgi:hypothetical protein